jgi:O-acetyl-ADP-ribose deacetylase (regulator of RNase III)
LEADVEAYVNTVNTVGVMGKGIALQFKNKFPHNYQMYLEACKLSTIDIGKLLVVTENFIDGRKIIINFPTKKEWFRKSQYAYIEEGLKDLVKIVDRFQIKSLALPPLGCGNGGLTWSKVKILIEKYLQNIPDTNIYIYEPSIETAIMSKELTPGRAMLMYALFEYEKMGEEVSLFVANKLAYFLQRSGVNLNVQFTANTYGPHAKDIKRVIRKLNGTFLTLDNDKNIEPFDPIHLNRDAKEAVDQYVSESLTDSERKKLFNMLSVIKGFESAFAMEILSSVDFLRVQYTLNTPEEVLVKMHDWNDRKKESIKDKHVVIAVSQLNQHATSLQY